MCTTRITHYILGGIVFFFCFQAYSSNIKGNVKDAYTTEVLIDVLVYIKENEEINTASNLEGNYELMNVPKGTFTIVCKYPDYHVLEKTIDISDSIDHYVLDFSLEEMTHKLQEVTLTQELDKESDQSARKSEQNADNVLNIMSAKNIQLMPDITVGNVLQRVSGVSIVRNASGDGQYAIIRGMDKRYNYTLVNGVKIPSPDNKNRYVPMDIFPSELLERLEVVKALTPNMEGDAIGGAMNMVMKSAPSKLTITSNIAGGFSDMFNANRPFQGYNTKNLPQKSPEQMFGPNYGAKSGDFGIKQLQYNNRNLPMNSLMSLSIGNRFFKKRLGVLLAGSYQNIFRGTNSVFYVPDEPAALPNPNTYLFQDVQLRQFSNKQDRLGMHAKFDYDINLRNKISLYNLFMELDEAQHRSYHSPIANGSGLAYNDFHDRSRFTKQKIYNNTLRGDHDLLLDKLKLDWTLTYSKASSITPAWSDMQVRYNYEDGNLKSKILLPVTQRWTGNHDEDKSGYLNLSYKPIKNLELSSGGLTRFKTRDNTYTEYELNTLVPGGSYQSFSSIDKATFSFLPASSAYANPFDPNNYTAKENISAIYIQGKYLYKNRLQVLGGIRNENTYQEYHSQLTVYKDGKDGIITYSDLLPSLHFKYILSKKQNIRLSYYAAVARPNYFEFIPIELSGDLFTESGNYKIKHTNADNYDLRYEFFNSGNEQILAGLFYKKIKNPIEYGFVPVTVSTSNVTPQNYGTATNYGFEFVISKYIKNFGLTANYTYTNSSIVQAKRVKSTIRTSDTTTTIVNSLQDQKRPLQGQSNHIANVTFLYKNTKKGIDATISWVYTGRRINIISPYKDLDYWQRGFSQFDFSGEKKIFKKFSIYVKITNLLNTPLITEVYNSNYLSSNSPAQDRKDRIVVQKDVFKHTYLLGLRYKF